MQSGSQSQEAAEDMPPGTVHLLQHVQSTEGVALTLEPQPSQDPNDPLNWTKLRKTVNYTLVLTLTLIVFTALSVQVIFWQLLVVDLNASFQQLNNAQSINAAGLTVGCLLFIPLTIKFGRRPVYIVSTAIIFGVIVWTSRMTTVNEMYVTNLFLGLASSTNEAIVGLTVADLFFVHQRGTMNGLYLVMVMSGSFLTPILAGVQATHQSWRWSYYLLAIFCGIILLCFIFFYEETKYVPAFQGQEVFLPGPSESVSGKDDSVTSIKPVGDIGVSADIKLSNRIDQSIPMRPLKQRLAFITPTPVPFFETALRPLSILFRFPAVMFAGLQYGFGLCWLVNLAVTISTVYPYPPYNFKPDSIGYMGVGPFIGNLIGSIYGGIIADKCIVWFAKRNKGYYEPEMRLYLLHLPSAAMCGGIIMFGITTAKGMHWIYPSIGGALFGFGLGSFGDASLTLVMDSYKELTGEAFVSITFVRNIFTIVMAQVRVPWITHMGLQNAYILMGFIALAVSLLYIPMIYFGKGWRVATAARYQRLAAKNTQSS